MRLIPLVALAVAIPGVAFADREAADRCASALQPAGKALYEKALPQLLTGHSLREAVTAAARGMVVSGLLHRDASHAASEQAGGCLKLLP